MTATVTGMPEPLSKTVLTRVTALMREREVTTYGLSKASGIPQSSLHRKLRGDAPLDLDDVQAVAGALGVGVVELLG